jgi:hypothetical protein
MARLEVNTSFVNTKRIAMIADIHLHNHRAFGGPMIAGLNSRYRAILQAMHTAYEAANKAEAGCMFILGDLFDTVRPTPQMMAPVLLLMEYYANTKNLQTVVVPGNHDKLSEAPGNNALGPLKVVADVCEEPCVYQLRDANVLVSPFRTGPASQWLLEDIKQAQTQIGDTKFGVLTHVGISDENTPPWLKGSDDSIDRSLLGDIAVFAGNWHEHKVMGFAVQVGALVPTGFDNPSPVKGTDPYGSLLICDGERNRRDIIPGPRFKKMSYTDGMVPAHVLRRSDSDPNLYVRFACDYVDMEGARGLGKALVEGNRIGDFEVVLDAQDKNRMHKQKIEAVHQASSIDVAVSKYVEKMNLPEGVLAKEISALTNQYIKRASKEEG